MSRGAPYEIQYQPLLTSGWLDENQQLLVPPATRVVAALYASNSQVAAEYRQQLEADAATGYDIGYPRVIHVHRKGEPHTIDCQLVTAGPAAVTKAAEGS